MTDEPLIRNVSDTALWVAIYRARENERPNPLFRDPFARRLAGARGEHISKTLSQYEWPFIIRTVVFDEFIMRAVANGADTVLNLGAGLDTRPYRMTLPAGLRWFEIDQAAIIDYKTEILASERPRCQLTRLSLDLADAAARQAAFADVNAGARNVLVVTEGLIIYFDAPDVGALATDLAAQSKFRTWITDLASPGLLRMLHRQYGAHLNEGPAPLKFAPENGVAFFEPHGWRAVTTRSSMKEAARLKRVNLFMRLIATLPTDPRKPGNRPWSGIVLLERN